jgi:hypothetical protein
VKLRSEAYRKVRITQDGGCSSRLTGNFDPESGRSGYDDDVGLRD